MLCDGNNVPCTGTGEKIEPRIGIETFCAEHRNEIFVAEFILRSVSGDVMLEGGIAWDIHVARVPFVSERRNRIDSPVEKDSELGIAKPVGRAVGCERVPSGAVGMCTTRVAVC